MEFTSTKLMDHPIVRKAFDFAVLKHEGQVRKFSGDPYVTHPIRVAESFTDPIYQAVGLLHDVMEDCGVTKDDLRKEGFLEIIVGEVADLTKVEGESYSAFIRRIICSGGIAMEVKLANIRDNMRDLDKDSSLRKKYEKALWILS